MNANAPEYIKDLAEKDRQIDDLTQHITRLRNEVWRLKRGAVMTPDERKDAVLEIEKAQDQRRENNAFRRRVKQHLDSHDDFLQQIIWDKERELMECATSTKSA